MKKLTILITAMVLFALLAGIGIVSAAPPPPVPQQLGRTDTQFPNVTVTECRNCHGGQPTPTKPYPANNIHHFMIGKKTTTLGCTDCHPNKNDGSGGMWIENNCINCHNGTGWFRNTAINLTIIRGKPGRPHHNTSKNSASNLAVLAKNMAADRNCKTPCHGESIIDNYNDGHEVKNLFPQLLSVFADFKINATQNEADTGVPGVEWGGCAACHDSAAANPIINNNHDTHHYETTDMLGRQCNYCHVSLGVRNEPIPDYSPEPSANVLRVWFNDSNGLYFDMYQAFNWDTSMRHVEISNWSMLTAGDTINGTGCLKCHSYRDLHTIEAAGPNIDGQYNINNLIGGYGHVGNSSDCEGCHAGYSASEEPYQPPGPISTGLDTIEPANIVEGTSIDVTLTGNNLDQSPTYITRVLLDGQPLTLKSVDDKSIVATVPGTTTVGAHAVQIEVGGVTGSMSTIIVAEKVTITSATLTAGVITITGTSFGNEALQMVTITKGSEVIASDSIASWINTQIKAASTKAAVGDKVTVSTSYGSATAIITEGTVPPVTGITVTSPNGGESWKQKSTHAITWNKVGTMGTKNIKIEILLGSSVKKTFNVPANAVSYNWAIGTLATGTTYKVRISSVNNRGEIYPIYTDTSEAVFSIVK
jgi:hypothetical protein